MQLMFSSPRPLAANVRLSESGDALPFHRHNVLGAKLLLPMTYALQYWYHDPTIRNAIVEFNNRDDNSNLHLKHGVFRVGRASRLVLALQHQPPRSAQQLEKITPTIHTRKYIRKHTGDHINTNTWTLQHSNTPSTSTQHHRNHERRRQPIPARFRRQGDQQKTSWQRGRRSTPTTRSKCGLRGPSRDTQSSINT
jgi:hypothetical protein